MNGRNRCKILKDIRRQIAENNDIEYITSECKYQGDCAGTCPKCEAELRYLERELEKRRKLGQTITLAGLTVAVTTQIAGCKVENNTEMGELAADDIQIHTTAAQLETDGEMIAIPTLEDVPNIPSESLLSLLKIFPLSEIRENWKNASPIRQEGYDLYRFESDGIEYSLAVFYNENEMITNAVLFKPEESESDPNAANTSTSDVPEEALSDDLAEWNTP